MPTRQDVVTHTARLDGDAVQTALLRMWARGLAHGADRPDVRRLANGPLVAMEECERLRRAGRASMAPEKVVVMFRDALLARGCRPPA
jgi:hypothetical protein